MMFPDDNFRQGCVPSVVQPGSNEPVVLLEDVCADPTFFAASGRSRFRSGHQLEVPVFFSGCKHIPGFGDIGISWCPMYDHRRAILGSLPSSLTML